MSTRIAVKLNIKALSSLFPVNFIVHLQASLNHRQRYEPANSPMRSVLTSRSAVPEVQEKIPHITTHIRMRASIDE